MNYLTEESYAVALSPDGKTMAATESRIDRARGVLDYKDQKLVALAGGASPDRYVIICELDKLLEQIPKK